MVEEPLDCCCPVVGGAFASATVVSGLSACVGCNVGACYGGGSGGACWEGGTNGARCMGGVGNAPWLFGSKPFGGALTPFGFGFAWASLPPAGGGVGPEELLDCPTIV